MRQSVLRKSSHFRFSLALIMALMFALALSACGGGGGGGGGNNGGGGGLGGIVLSGAVVNSASNSPVQGAKVSIVGTNLSATTNANGQYSIAGVPSTATQFVVTPPNLSQYFNYVNYNGSVYNMGSPACALPLPTPLKTGSNTVSPVSLYPTGTPPPPPTGCTG